MAGFICHRCTRSVGHTSVIALLLLLAALPALAQQPDALVVRDIRVEGLQRISEGTVYNYMPLDRGDTLNSSTARAAIRELYRTGFFKDISMRREGNILVIDVLERPAIASVTSRPEKTIRHTITNR